MWFLLRRPSQAAPESRAAAAVSAAKVRAAFWILAMLRHRRRVAAAAELEMESSCRTNPDRRLGFRARVAQDRWPCRPPEATSPAWVAQGEAVAWDGAMGPAAAYLVRAAAPENKAAD